MFLFADSLVIAVGLLRLLKPEAAYSFEAAFRSHMADEPSKFNLISNRISGGVAIILGIIGIVMQLC